MAKIRQYPRYTSAELIMYAGFINKYGVSKIESEIGLSKQTLSMMASQLQKTYKKSTKLKIDLLMEKFRLAEIEAQEIDHPSALLKPIDPNALPTLPTPEPTMFVLPDVGADVNALIAIHNIMAPLDQKERNSVLNWFVYKYQQGNN